MPVYNNVVPGLKNVLSIIWPTQRQQAFSFATNVVVSVPIQYNITSNVVATAIIEWNIGMPLSSQIRQTSADRTDFAY